MVDATYSLTHSQTSQAHRIVKHVPKYLITTMVQKAIISFSHFFFQFFHLFFLTTAGL